MVKKDRPLLRASRRWGLQGPTSQRPECTRSPSAPPVPGTQECRRTFLCGPRSPSPPCRVQSRQSSHTPQCPAAGCQASSLCILRQIVNLLYDQICWFHQLKLPQMLLEPEKNYSKFKFKICLRQDITCRNAIQ